MKEKSPITEEELQNIERYLNKQMRPEERLAFEKKMQEDEGFEYAVKEYGTLIRGIELSAFKIKLQEFHKALDDNPGLRFQESGETGTKNFSYLFLAAAFVGATLILFSAWWLTLPPENERLFAEYFTPDPGLITPMSATDDYIFYKAMVEYKQEDYREAISRWQSLLQSKPANDTLNYFTGVAYLADKDADAAIPFLQKVLAGTESVFENDAYFYLGLAYLKQNRTEEAIQAFEKSTLEESSKIVQELKE